MSNYRVILKTDGTYQARYMIQDGWEEEITHSRSEAIQACIDGARIMNGVDITERDIRFGKYIQVVRSEVVWEPPSKCHACGR